MRLSPSTLALVAALGCAPSVARADDAALKQGMDMCGGHRAIPSAAATAAAAAGVGARYEPAFQDACAAIEAAYAASSAAAKAAKDQADLDALKALTPPH